MDCFGFGHFDVHFCNNFSKQKSLVYNWRGFSSFDFGNDFPWPSFFWRFSKFGTFYSYFSFTFWTYQLEHFDDLRWKYDYCRFVYLFKSSSNNCRQNCKSFSKHRNCCSFDFGNDWNYFYFCRKCGNSFGYGSNCNGTF